MPNLKFINVRLNLDIDEDASIYQSLSQYQGDRSRLVRTALLAYFKDEPETTRPERNRRKTTTKQKIVEAVGQTHKVQAAEAPATSATAPVKAIDESSELKTETQKQTNPEVDNRVKEMLNLIQ